ncbi:hypothetical protein [Schaalia cardiffensis]|nr:hypothetical protein [Schaalia cardiffensis]
MHPTFASNIIDALACLAELNGTQLGVQVIIMTPAGLLSQASYPA